MAAVRRSSVLLLVTLLFSLTTVITAHSHSGEEEEEEALVGTVSVDRFHRETAALHCPVKEGQEFLHWVTAGDDVINVNFTNTTFMSLQRENYTLFIHRVAKQDLGEYLCLIRDTGRYKYYRVKLYLYIPPTWEIYRENFIIAVCCAGGFLVVVGLILVVYSCRWQPRHQELDIEEENQPKNGYVNATYAEMNTYEEAATNLDYKVEPPRDGEDAVNTSM